MSRFFRIAPAYYCAVFIWYFFMESGKSTALQGIKDIVTYLLFIHSYFDSTRYSISGVLWYIGIQPSFFIITPFIFILWPKLNTILKTSKSRKYMLAMLFWVLTVFIGWWLYGNKIVQYHSFIYMLPSYLFGMLLPGQKGQSL